MEMERNLGGRPRNKQVAAMMERGIPRTTAFRLLKKQRAKQLKTHARTGISRDPQNVHPQQFHATPPRAVRALLTVETFNGIIWEPCCGDGAISRVLEAAGYTVISTDLVDRGYGIGGHDFLADHTIVADSVITNPPYGGLAKLIVSHALTRVTGKVAMLLPVRWQAAQGHRHLMDRCARIWVFSRRLQMHRAGYIEAGGKVGGPQMDVAWFVFEPNHSGPTMTKILPPECGEDLAKSDAASAAAIWA
jgi:hypothetical protein